LILLDTHVFVWALMAPTMLSAAVRAAVDNTPERALSSASLYEIAYKHQIGKWPEVSPLINSDIDEVLRQAGITVLPADQRVMLQAGALDWAHRDPFDRIIVVSAAVHGVALISRDKTLDQSPLGIRRIW